MLLLKHSYYTPTTIIYSYNISKMVSSIEFADNQELYNHLLQLIGKMMSLQGEANRLNIFKDILNILLVNKMFLENNPGFRDTIHRKILEILKDDFAKQDDSYVNLSNIMLRVIEELNNEQVHALNNNNQGINDNQDIDNPRVIDNDEYDIINDELLMIRQEHEYEDDYQRNHEFE